MMLTVDSLCFAYKEKTILDKISFSIEKGEIVVLIGMSGSGKTTLFRLITGALTPAGGHIYIDEKPLSEGGVLTTYMRQEDLLLPWRTVLENLLLCTELGKKSKDAKNSFVNKAQSLLRRVGLDGMAHAYPYELSGGMRQRVALARALLQNRPLMLFDEPFASLDVIIREQLYALVREIRDQYAKTLFMVTHDFRDAMALADRIFVLSQGKIVDHCSITAEMRKDPLSVDQLIHQIRYQLLA